MLACRRGFTGIATHEEVFEEIADKLQGHVFEGECRPVKELEQVQLPGGIEGHERGDVGGAERGVAAGDDVPQVGSGDLVGGNVEREDVEGEIFKREVGPVGQGRRGEDGDVLGDEEAAWEILLDVLYMGGISSKKGGCTIAGEAFQHDVLKGQLPAFQHTFLDDFNALAVPYIVRATAGAQISLRWVPGDHDGGGALGVMSELESMRTQNYREDVAG